MEEDTDLVDGPPVPVHERYFTNFYHVVKGENKWAPQMFKMLSQYIDYTSLVPRPSFRGPGDEAKTIQSWDKSC